MTSDEEDEIKQYKISITMRRAKFESLNLEKVNYVKSYLLLVYGVLVLILSYTMFKNKDVPLKEKGVLISLMIVYPYVAPPMLIYLYEMFMYIIAVMTGEIYKKTELQ